MGEKKSLKHSDHRQSRPFIGVLFECCHVYSRIYREESQMEYTGHCPKCMRSLCVRVDPKEGVPTKFLKAF